MDAYVIEKIYAFNAWISTFWWKIDAFQIVFPFRMLEVYFTMKIV